MSLTAILTLAAGSALSAYSGGTGDPNTPYQIANVADFQQLSATPTDWNKSFILTANIDLTGLTFTKAPIAPDTSTSSGFQGTPFTGVFDGNGHIISNLTITAYASDYIGLFGYVGTSGKIRNLGVENVNIAGRFDVGGLVGENYLSTITDCYATGSVSGTDTVGGLVGGIHYLGMVTRCYATGSVSGNYEVGGLVGYNYDSGTVTYCYATGSVSGTGQYSSAIGGLVGYNYSSCKVTNCYATGSVSGTGQNFGGLVGLNYCPITNCYATGAVSGGSNVGGLVGKNSGWLTACYWDTQTSGKSFGVGYNTSTQIYIGVTGKTTAKMKTKSTFTFYDYPWSSGWNFTAIWAICEGTNYPRLLWSIPAADLVCPDGVNFADYSFFAERWQDTNCAANNDCDGTDLDVSGAIDWKDMMIFCQHWLEGI